MADNLEIKGRDPSLYNEDLAPIPVSKRTWGWFEIFNVWANDVQSLFGYTLAASLFLTYGLNGWSVFAAILIAGFFVMWLVNMMGEPSVKYGIPFPVMAFGTLGAIIRLRSQPQSRTALLEMGAAGPIAGLVVAVLCMAWGLPGTQEVADLGAPGVEVLISCVKW